MRTRLFYQAMLAAGIALAFAGCEAEHKKFVKDSNQSINWNKERAGIMYQVAEQDYRVGDLDKCREQLKKALAEDVPYAPIHMLAAKVEMEGGSLDEATIHLKRAVIIDPANPEALYLLGVVYQRCQKYETAFDYYQQASVKNAGEARYVLAAAEMQITLGQLDEAKEMLEDKIGFFEQSASMQIALARIAALQGDKAGAARHYRDATMLVPEDKNIRWSYASALFDAGKYSDAVRILEDMRKDPPTMPRTRESIAEKMTDAARASDAELDAAAALSTQTSLLMMLGESYVGLKRPMDARDCFQEVIRLQPDNASAYLSLGKSCLMTDELSVTTAAAQKVLRMEPENVSAMILQAAVLQKEKKWSEAFSALTKAEKVAPRNSTVLCMQGLSSLQLGRKDTATTYFAKAVTVNPTDAWANSLLEQVRPTPVQAPVAPVQAPVTQVQAPAAAVEAPITQVQAPAEPVLEKAIAPFAPISVEAVTPVNVQPAVEGPAGVTTAVPTGIDGR